MASRSGWQAAAVAAAVLAVFAPTLRSDFVYDARMQILVDPFIHDAGNWWPVLTGRVMGMDVLDFNRPVHLASLMADAAVWGRQPFGFHLTSILLHATNVLLLRAVLRRLAPGLPAVALVAVPLVFAVHPLVTEAVCEPSCREDLLVATFTLAALALAIGHAPAAGGDAWRAAACVACSLLAVGSKESGIAAPAALGAYWFLFRRGERGWFWPVVVGGAKLAVLGFLATRFLLEPHPSRIFEFRPTHLGGSLAAALAIEPRILALSAQLVVAPVNLCADYGPHSLRHLPLPLALVVLAGLVAAAVVGIRRDRRLAIAVALLVVPLVPVANLVPIYRPAADRYLYLPLAGVCLGLGLLLDGRSLAGRPALRRGLCIACLAAAALLAVGCVARQRVWAGSLALWEDTWLKNPLSYNAAAGRGDALRRAGRLDEAERAAREAIRLSDGTLGDPWVTLALVLDGQGRDAEARAALERALETQPALADPDARVAALAMDPEVAAGLKRLLAGRRGP